jgi:hypothetical protein
VGLVQPFRISLANEGADVRGQIDVFDNTFSGRVEGVVDVDDRIRLSGALENAEGKITMSTWTSAVEAGIWKPDIVNWRYSFKNLFGPQVLLETWEFIEVVRR